MSVSPRVFARLESASKNRTDSDGIKIVCRHDAPGGDLGPVADAERGPHNFGHDKRVNQRATPLQIEEIRPGDESWPCLSARRSGERKELLLMHYFRVRAEQYAFNPTKDGGI